jgi:hypothetical protein
LPPRPILSWNRLLVQSSTPGRYRAHGFRGPIPPLAFPRPYGLPQPGAAGCFFKLPIASLFEFRLPPESFPVAPSRRNRRGGPSATLLGFDSLQHIQDSGVHLPRVCLARYVPPSGFGYPPGGLLPPGPGRPFFMPTALLGFCPSKLSPLERSPGSFDPEWTHLPFSLPLLLWTNPPAGPASPGSWALTLPRVPCPHRCG